MTRTIEIDGLHFAIKGDGFGAAPADFDLAVDAIEASLATYSADDRATAHRDSLVWASNNCEGDRPAMFDALEVVGWEAATNGWHRPSAAGISVSAAL